MFEQGDFSLFIYYLIIKENRLSSQFSGLLPLQDYRHSFHFSRMILSCSLDFIGHNATFLNYGLEAPIDVTNVIKTIKPQLQHKVKGQMRLKSS